MSILPYLSTASPVSAMHLAAFALTRARVCNHSAPKRRLLQRRLPTLPQHQGLLLVLLYLVQNSAKFTPYRCSPKRFICAASGCKTIFIGRPCFHNLECASPIMDGLPISR